MQLSAERVVCGTFSDISEASDAQLRELYSRLVLDSLMTRALLGNSPVEPKPLRNRKAVFLADKLADFFAANLNNNSGGDAQEVA